jgi:hypothetical protein
MRTIYRALFLLALGVAGACTVDDSIVEGKACVLGSTNPDSSCMTGYECRCGDGKCLCVKVESLRQPLRLESQAASDPSLLLLRRLGLEP